MLKVTAGLEFQLRLLLSATFSSCRHLTLFTIPSLDVPEDCKEKQAEREPYKAIDKNSNPGINYIYCTNNSLTITKIFLKNGNNKPA